MDRIKKTHLCTILQKDKISEAAYKFVLQCLGLSAQAYPGQFAHIAVEGKTLRRPISLADIDPENGTVTIVFEIRGEGTAWLAERNAGDALDVLGPLGHGFTTYQEDKKVLLIGGGIGTPPLLPLAKIYGNRATALLGFRSKDFVILEDEFKSAGANVIVATDDGSYGHKGFLTPFIEAEIASNTIDRIFSCGPMPLLKIVSEIADENSIPCQISLEERMGCGVGACLVCACQTNTGMKHVCKDGPVFDNSQFIIHNAQL